MLLCGNIIPLMVSLGPRNLGTSANDQAYGVASLPGGQAVAVGGIRPASSEDIFIQSFNAWRDEWTQTLSTVTTDKALGVTTDASGNIYVTGYTSGALDPSDDSYSDTFAGVFDSFVTKYDSSGTAMVSLARDQRLRSRFGHRG